MALTAVPPDVQCLEVMVSVNTGVDAATTTTQLFPITAGQLSTITVIGLPSGRATVSEEAFGVSCDLVQPNVKPTWISAAPVSVTLAPGVDVEVSIVLVLAGQLQITTTFSDASFSASPAALTFGGLALGTTATMTSEIMNTGTTAEDAPPLTVSGPNAGDFTAPEGAATCASLRAEAQVVPPGNACTLVVSFTPTSAGAESATLTIGSEALGFVTTVPLSGVGMPPTYGASPPALAFGDVLVGTAAQLSAEATNTGTTSEAAPFLTLSGPDAADFGLPAAASTCLSLGTAVGSIETGSGCLLLVTFTPTSAGAKSATLTVGSNVPGFATTTIAVSGVGTGPSFGVSPQALSFGNALVGTISAQLGALVTNTGASSESAPPVTLSGPDAASFTLVTGTSNCVSFGASSLPPGNGGCQVNVTFTPVSAGPKSATVTIGSAALGFVTTIALSGTGVAAAASLSITPTSVAFGTVTDGSSATSVETVTNNGTAVGAVVTSLTGTSANQFSVVAGGGTGTACSATAGSLGVGASCTVTVRFTPNSAGAKSASLGLATATGATPTVTVALTGTGH